MCIVLCSILSDFKYSFYNDLFMLRTNDLFMLDASMSRRSNITRAPRFDDFTRVQECEHPHSPPLERHRPFV